MCQLILYWPCKHEIKFERIFLFSVFTEKQTDQYFNSKDIYLKKKQTCHSLWWSSYCKFDHIMKNKLLSNANQMTNSNYGRKQEYNRLIFKSWIASMFPTLSSIITLSFNEKKKWGNDLILKIFKGLLLSFQSSILLFMSSIYIMFGISIDKR